MSLSISSTLGATSALTQPSNDGDADDVAASGATPRDNSQVSQRAQLMHQLQQLAQSNPEKFKQVTAALAQELSDAAGQASGAQAQHLTDLSKAFDQASQTGQLPQRPEHAHHHHGAGAQGVKQYQRQQGSGAASQLDQLISAALNG